MKMVCCGCRSTSTCSRVHNLGMISRSRATGLVLKAFAIEIRHLLKHRPLRPLVTLYIYNKASLPSVPNNLLM